MATVPPCREELQARAFARMAGSSCCACCTLSGRTCINFGEIPGLPLQPKRTHYDAMSERIVEVRYLCVEKILPEHQKKLGVAFDLLFQEVLRAPSIGCAEGDVPPMDSTHADSEVD
jgi:hypothetical protein